ncbi:MAG: hypothetical protein HIU91_10050 [Acidobacteria bacterium]|nr:hypothetical protein [Acidobacteriota bacterium]
MGFIEQTSNDINLILGRFGKAVLSDTTPDAPSGSSNIQWQTDVYGNISAYGTGGGLSTPPLDYTAILAAVSDTGSAFAAGMTRYSANAPVVGSVNSASSALGYMAFAPQPTAPEYAEFTTTLPPYWTSSAIQFDFYTPGTSGTVIWEVETACPESGDAGTTTFGSPLSVSTTVSATANTYTVTAVLSGIATPGANDFPPATSTVPTPMTVRILRSATDTCTAQANLLKATLITGRSQ